MSITQAGAVASAQADSIAQQFRPKPEQEAIGYLPIKVRNLERAAALPHPGYVRPSLAAWSARGPEPSLVDLLI
jgi:hypothetical protein